jgi:hypothetical protein
LQLSRLQIVAWLINARLAIRPEKQRPGALIVPLSLQIVWLLANSEPTHLSIVSNRRKSLAWAAHA